MKSRFQYSYMYAVVMVIFVGCGDPNRGQSAANEDPVKDGQIVMVRRGNELGAFTLSNQRHKPDLTDYSWYYRSDGKGYLSDDDPAVTTGFVSNATAVSFMSFSVDWSYNTRGKGWVYFSALPTDLKSKTDYEMCVTTETNISTIDGFHRRWKYRARPSVNVQQLIGSQVKEITQ